MGNEIECEQRILPSIWMINKQKKDSGSNSI
jgi:hypothetical protein